MQHNYTAIVLGKYDYGERDRLYVLLTREVGKIVVRGAGARKQGAKLSPHLETGSIVSVSVARSRGRGVITYASAESGTVYASVAALGGVLRVCACVNALTVEYARDTAVFDTLIQYIHTINAMATHRLHTQAVNVVTEGVLFRILDTLGWRAQVSACATCGQVLATQISYAFGLRQSGLLCVSCARHTTDSLQISRASATALRIFATNTPASLVKLIADAPTCAQLATLTNRRLRWIR